MARTRVGYIISAGNLTDGSAAREINHASRMLPEDPYVRPKKPLAPAPKRNLFLPVTAVAVIALVIMTIVSFSGLSAARRENDALHQQLTAASAEQDTLRQTVDSILTPEAVENYAVAHGMAKPGEDQTVQVQVPHTVE